MEQEDAYNNWLDAATTLSCLAYEIAEIRATLLKMEEERVGAGAEEKETQATKQEKEALEERLAEAEKEYNTWFDTMESAEKAVEATAGANNNEPEGEYFEVAESCADW